MAYRSEVNDENSDVIVQRQEVEGPNLEVKDEL